MTADPSRALILFAREPLEGRVKTRLGSLLDAATTLKLYHHFLKDSIHKICSVPGVRRFIGMASPPATDYFKTVSLNHAIDLFIQEGKDLGERMRNAFQCRFDEGCERVVIIGADSPTLPVHYIERAFESEKEVVIGPSTDGGYYLVGMTGKVTDIFSGVSWGTDRVLADTLRLLKEQQTGVELLPVWYDVDLPEDLRFLKTHLEWMAHAGMEERNSTLEFLKQLPLE